ncbi:MAG: hypothetical protein LBF27_22200 [Sphingobacterium sp.]|nr:hypothetical protein [Sphingobacterium sp.]
MKRINLFILVFFCSLMQAIGQYTVNTLNEYTTVNTKYTNFPILQQDGVDHYSGRLKLSYNLLSSFGSDPLLKVFLSYNGGGVRVLEEASRVGLGWNLYNHPTISREIRGLSDIDALVGSTYNGYTNTNISVPTYSSFFSDSLQQAFQSNRFELFTDLRNLGISNWDTEPDIFTLNLGEKTIKFVLPQRWGRNIFEAKLINKEDKTKIVFDWTNKSFNVLDDLGNEYIFDIKDYALSVAAHSGYGPMHDQNSFRVTTGYENPVLTTWHASIIRKVNKEEIKYRYQLVNASETPYVTESYSKNACFVGATNQYFTVSSKSYGTFLTEREIHQLDEIEFPLGTIKFQYSDRIDLPLGKGEAPYITNLWQFYHYKTATLHEQKLEKILLKDLSDKIIHQAAFTYSYFNKSKISATDKTEFLRLKLDKIVVDEEAFAFTYYKPDSLPSKLSHSIDYYGFNNGRSNNGRIPANTVKYFCSSDVHCGSCSKDIAFDVSNDKTIYGNRRPSLDAGKIGTLVDITNNKGQRTEVDYELNNILYNNSDSINSGYNFNIKEVKEYVALYEYKPAQTEVFSIDPASSSNPLISYERICGANFDKPQGESHYYCDISYEDLQKVAMEVVNASTGAVVSKIYHYDTLLSSIYNLPKGKYFIRFTSLHDPWNVIYNPGFPNDNKIYYFAARIKIKERDFDIKDGWINAEIGGLRVRSLSYYDQTVKQLQKIYSYNFFDNGQSSGKLSHPYVNFKDEITERVEIGERGGCTPVSSVIKNVVFSSDPTIYVPNEQPIVGYSNVRETILDNNGMANGYTNYVFHNLRNEYQRKTDGSYNHKFNGVPEDPFQLWYNYFPLKSYFHINGKLKSATTFDDKNKRLGQVNYNYESENYNLSKVVVNGGRLRASNFEQYTCDPVPVVVRSKLTTYQPYVIYDMTNPLLKQTTIDYSSTNIQKEEIWKYRTPSYNLESYIVKGSDSKDRTVKYIYPGDPESDGMGYVNSLLEKNMVRQPLVTTILNAGQEVSRVNFTYGLFHNKYLMPSTEIHYSKGSNVSQQFTFDYSLKNGRVQRIEKTSSIPIIYLWGYNGQYPIAEIKNATFAEVTGALTQAVMDNLNLPNVSENSIVSTMAKLRNSLPKSMITSYTYKPLVGMTSKTDPRGIKETYTYDGMQRLQAILDHLNYVNRSFDYHYRSN